MNERRKIGLCLCGGGITGAMYEVGCLAAIEEAVPGFQLADIDVFIGASSGATVAMALAGGYSAGRLYRALLDPADDFFPLQRHHLLRFDSRELKRVASSVFGAARRVVSSATAKPLKLDVWEELDRFYDSLPAGLSTIEPYERFLSEFSIRRGIPHSFSRLPGHLLVVANDLDGGERVIFGRGFIEDVPVPRAVAASAAVPLLYAPVRVGDRDIIAGGLGDTGHVDIAVELGCDLVIVINAMVPVDVREQKVPTGHGQMRRVRDKGMFWVYNQSWRLVAHSRMSLGIERFRSQHPDSAIVLLEPGRDDAIMFMYSPTNFTARRVIMEDGYTSTMHLLKDPESAVSRALANWGASTD